MIGTTWQIIVNLAQADKAKVEAVLPSEGATGWSDTWMVGDQEPSTRPARTCGWTTSSAPRRTPQVAEWFGEAPSNAKSCDLTADKSHCDTFHAADEAYFDQVWYWSTPIAQCLDGRTDVDVQGLRRVDGRPGSEIKG